MLRDILLQICQVLAVLLLAPLLQGIIQQFEERVQLAQGPGIFQPYRDLWKLFHKQIVVPETRFLDLLDRAVRRLHRDDDGAHPHSGVDRFPAAAVRHGRHSRRRTYSHARLVHDRACRPRHRQRLRRYRLEPRGNGRDPGGADAHSGVCRNYAAGESDAAVRGQSSVGRQPRGLLEPGASVPDRGILHAAHRRDRPAADPFQHPHRSLHDRGGANPRIFRSAAGHSPLGVNDEAIHPLHDLLQRPAASHGGCRARARRLEFSARLPR